MAIKAHIHILKAFGLERSYLESIRGTGTEKQAAGQLIGDIQSLLGREGDDAGARDYYDTRRLVLSWRAKNRDEEKPTPRSAKKGRVLYFYKRALSFGDFTAAAEHIKQYFEMGGKAQALSGSITKAHPLAGIPKEKRHAFRQSLKGRDADVVGRGIKWYGETY